MIIRIQWCERLKGTRLSSKIQHSRTRLGLVAHELVGHWSSVPKGASSIPTVVRLTFQSAGCGYALRITYKTSYVYFRLKIEMKRGKTLI